MSVLFPKRLLSHRSVLSPKGTLREERQAEQLAGAYGGSTVDSNLIETLDALIWYDFSDPTTITVEGGGPPVSQGDILDSIASKGSLGGVAFSSSEALSPFWDTAHGIANEPMVYFDSDHMASADVGDVERPYSMYAVVVADELTRGIDNYYIQFSSSTFDAWVGLHDEDVWSINTVSTSTAAAEDLTLTGLVMTRDGGTDSENWYSNDAADAVDATLGAVDPGISSVELGSQVGGAAVIGMKGWLAEYAIFDRQLGAGEVENLQRYASRKWGVTWA